MKKASKKSNPKKSTLTTDSKKVEAENYSEKFTETEDHYDPDYPFAEQDKSTQPVNEKIKK